MQRQYRAIGVGSPLQDLLASVPENFLAQAGGAKGGMELIDAAAMRRLVAALPSPPAQAIGGSAANTLAGLGRLGLRGSFLGKLGQDAAGTAFRNGMAALGVDGSRFRFAAQEDTGRCLCLITPDSQRTMRTCLGAASTLAPAEVSADDFAAAEHVHVEGYVLFNRELAARVLACARQAGCRISLDLASFEVVKANAGILERLLRDYVDVIFANEDEAAAFCGSRDPRAGVAALSRLCPCGAVKLGAKGALLWRDGQTIEVAAQPARAIDTTGAGDLWAAGFLYGCFTGRDLATCGRFGAVLGAEVVQVLGAAIPEARWAVIRTQLQGA